MSEVFVKVGKVPGAIKELALEEGATVAQVLETAGIDLEGGYSVRLNGDPIEDLDIEVDNDDSVTLVREVKGNSVASVKVGKVPGVIQTIAIDETTTVGQALELAGIAVERGFSVRHNGEVVTDMSRRLNDDDSVTLVREVKGND